MSTTQLLTSIPTPLGEMTAATDGHAVTGLWFSDQDPAPVPLSPDAQWADCALFGALRAWVDGYFRGNSDPLPLPAAPSGTDFRRRVWGLLAEIPYGATATYGDLAARLGSSPRAVGRAVGANPILLVLPCHRVIGADGALTGFAGGLERKKALLELERRGAARQAGDGRPWTGGPT